MPGHLIITRGYSGSGKTTWALEFVEGWNTKAVAISRDEIRTNVFGAQGKTVLTDKEEQRVTKIQQEFVRAALRLDKIVVVHDTNLVLRYARQWANIAEDEDAQFTVQEFHTPVEECIARNEGRILNNRVPEEVIRKQAKRWPFPWPEVTPKPRTTQDDGPAPYVPDESLPPAIIVDLDGTLAILGDRNPYDAANCHLDTLDETVSDIATKFWEDDYHIIFLSGRKETYRTQTEQWLDHHEWSPQVLPNVHGPFMRASADGRPDFVVKAELFDKHVRGKFNVRFALDDRDQVVRLWRDMGIKTLQVADGNF
ncbi:polynucleotide kinase [Stenotrophomonas virus Jojan60]|nr:polynucleotide kinase [Stenotrophomonas virus Jojan60]